MKKAVFPGSFDPITLGHKDVISRAIPLFDEIIIAIGINSDKNYMFSLEQRKKFIEECFQEYDNVKVAT
jgi:pantetheine-phosphate adenylyltransferase